MWPYKPEVVYPQKNLFPPGEQEGNIRLIGPPTFQDAPGSSVTTCHVLHSIVVPSSVQVDILAESKHK